MSLNETISNLGDSIINLVDKKRHGTLGLEQGDIGYDKEVWSDIYKYKHSTFDKSKFTVVGSPIITDDGIVSGLNTSNHLKGSFTAITPSKIIFRVKGVYSSTPNAANGSQVMGQIKGTNSSPSIEYLKSSNILTANRFHTSASISNFSAYIIVPLNDGDIVEAEVIATSTSVTLNAKINGVSYTNTWSGNGLYCGAINGYSVSTSGNWYWTGSIDLKNFSITADGREVFSGNKTGLDVIKPDNYTVIGSPVISEDGVASGFNSNNVLTLSLGSIVNGKKTMEFLSPVYYIESNPTHEVGLFGSTRTPNHHSFEFWLSTNLTLTATIYYGQDISGIMVRGSVPGISVGDTLQFKITKDDTYWNVYYRINNLEYIQVRSVYPIQEDSRLLDFDTSKDFYIGGETDNTDTHYDCGSVDLNAFKIYVDGKLVYQPCLKIPYTESKAGSKIVDEIYRGRVIDLYEQEGYAGYYTIQEGKKGNYIAVGSPAINADWVAGGLTTSSTIQPPPPYNVSSFLNVTKSWDITIKIQYLSADSGDRGLFLHNQFPLKGCICIDDTSVGLWGEPIDGHEGAIVTETLSNLGISNGDFVNIRVTFDVRTLTYTLYASKNNEPLSFIKSAVKTGNLTVANSTNPVKFACYDWGGYRYNFNGSIDLNAFKIYIDGKLAYQTFIPPNYTLPMGDVYGVLSAKANSSEISSYAMPSEVYTDLTLGASGTTYTAPADGYFFLDKSITDQSQFTIVTNTNTNLVNQCTGVNLKCVSTTPARKGDVVSVTYTAAGATNAFKFIYAEGSKGEKQ